MISALVAGSSGMKIEVRLEPECHFGYDFALGAMVLFGGVRRKAIA